MRLPGLSPFPLDPAHALPVAGEFHPLRREFHRWMSWANATTMFIALTALGIFLSLPRNPAAPRPHVSIVIDPPPEIPVPPSIHVVRPPRVPVSPTLGTPVPVEDWKVLISDFPTAEQMSAAYDDLSKLGQDTGGDINVISKEPPLPTPDQIVIAEVYPQLLRMNAPIYPPLAREAGIEGTVVLRVLVSKEGKVLNVIVLSGNPMLAEAARTAAFTAQFSPALQQHKPVPVWVQLPVVFSLK